MNVTVIPIVISTLCIVTKGLVQGLENLEIRGGVKTIKTTAFLYRAEYWQVSRRLEGTCYRSDSSESPSANVDVRNSKGEIIIIITIMELHLTDGMELQNQDKIRTRAENETYNYLGILEADTIKQVQMKNKIQKEYLRTRKLLQTKLSSQNLITGINTWDVPLVRYSDSKTIYKNTMGDWLRPSETILITRCTRE